MDKKKKIGRNRTNQVGARSDRLTKKKARTLRAERKEAKKAAERAAAEAAATAERAAAEEAAATEVEADATAAATAAASAQPLVDEYFDGSNDEQDPDTVFKIAETDEYRYRPSNPSYSPGGGNSEID